MKLKFSILSISALALLIIACEPRDGKLSRVDTRANANGAPAGTQADNYKYIGILADRQVEVIELFRALTDEAYAKGKEIVVEDVEIKGVKVKKVTAKLDLKNDKYETTRKLIMQANLSSDANGKLQSIDAKEVETELSFEKVLKRGVGDISLNNKLKRIFIQRAENFDSWNAKVEQLDQVNVKAGKSMMLNTIEFSFAAIDGNQDVFKITDVRMTHLRSGLQIGDFSLRSKETTTMTVEMRTADKCSSISGILHLVSLELNKEKLPTYERILTYDKSEVIMKAGNDTFTLTAPDCESRLTVDLRKIL